jgi:S-adenosylmethionine-diacylgycerolhomoserine-N-methlytransferase
LPEVSATVPDPADLPRNHARLMDSIYRSQRHIYDATRKYYLFGRDRLIARLDLPEGATVLEIGCGTGRNLALISKRWPGARLFGLDISAEMLKSANANLGSDASLAQGDATNFDAATLFGRAQFDRVVLSFATSMIPQWQMALAQACVVLAPGGSLHVVDFGDMSGMSAPLRLLLRAWLDLFHVSPRPDLPQQAARIAARHKMTLRTRRGLGGYYTLITLYQRGPSQ